MKRRFKSKGKAELDFQLDQFEAQERWLQQEVRRRRGWKVQRELAARIAQLRREFNRFLES